MKTYLLTRAAHQNQSLIEKFTSLGAHCIELPCIEITFLQNQTTFQQINQYDLAIFTSQNAVSEQLQAIDVATSVLAVGPATQAALRQQGIEGVIAPHKASSEGLLELPELQQVAQQKIVLYMGENPKPLLHDQLTRRAAVVDEIYCYQRNCPTYPNEMIERITQIELEAIVVTSHEVLDNLISIFSRHPEWLRQQRLMVLTESIHQYATELGFALISSLRGTQ